jgi:uncharacterized protein (TIGR00369 family)
MSDAPPAEPPDGFVPFERRGPFSRHNGPFFHRPNAAETEHGFYVLRRHCNGFGIAHGGLLASFLDGLLGHAVSDDAGRAAVTIQLSLSYLAMARTGEWVRGEARVTRRTADVAFAEAKACVGERDVVRAAAVFKLLDPRHLRS